jgi:predicted component of type VI protein secretion system
MRAVIQYSDRPHCGKVVLLRPETIYVGRARDCDIRINDRSVHRRHAIVFNWSGRYWIRACSGDGLIVDGVAVNNHPFMHLDKVRCGNVTLEYFEEEDDA